MRERGARPRDRPGGGHGRGLGALHRATSLAFEGLAFSLPWAYVGAAVGMVLAVLALSVAYALVRARAGSIVEALRADAI